MPMGCTPAPKPFWSTTAKNGREFLGKVVNKMPFEAEAIQIKFEAECKARGIDLRILPPKSPELDGCVERTNGT